MSKTTVKKANLMVDVRYNQIDLINCMRKDKKNVDNKISFLLPHELGKCKEYTLEDKELAKLLKQAGELI